MEWFFKIFKTEESTYVYDARTNAFLRLSEGFNQDNLLEEINRRYEEHFGEDISKRFLGIEKILFPVDRDQIIEKVKHEMKELVLNVTENCNFRCDYCIYGGKYFFERTHSLQRMNREIAQRAIDIFFSHNDQVDPVYIGFYGGEPLMAYDLIKWCVDTVKEQYNNKHVIFGMTTNGSLLTPEKFDFLAKNDFNLLVSIDGPKAIHDRNRKLIKGLGTYEIIMKNLKRLKEYAPDYYKEIGFIATILDPMELKAVNEFFENDDLLKEHRIIISFVNPYDTSIDIPSHPDEVVDNMFLDLANLHHTSILRQSGYSALLQRMFDPDLKVIYERDMSILGSYVPTKGACIPGNRKIFVTTSGDIQMCERVGKAFKIGNVYTGIDYDKIVELVDEYVELMQDCRTCWAVRLCRPCHAYFRKNDKLSLERKREVCPTLRDNIVRALYIYVKTYEKSPEALKQYIEQLP
ncbi:MAG: radical SAM protein [Candidatus Aenigmatarchaeota archaeon]